MESLRSAIINAFHLSRQAYPTLSPYETSAVPEPGSTGFSYDQRIKAVYAPRLCVKAGALLWALAVQYNRAVVLSPG
jgi:hypothetical protein